MSVADYVMIKLVRRLCLGPISFEDQGIEYCHACGTCTCCAEGVDHSAAEYLCFKGADGRCCLTTHKTTVLKWECGTGNLADTIGPITRKP